MTADQECMFRLLCSFKEICEKHGLTYYLGGGTLLGAVRHKGFIPWDDDVDITMPLEDFLRFQEVGKSLPNPLMIQSADTDPLYPFVFIKLCDTSHPFHTGYECGPKGIYIDIFPLITAKKPWAGIRFLFHVIQVINYVLQVKVGWTAFIPYKRSTARIGFRLLSIFPVNQLRHLRKWIIVWIHGSIDSGTYCSPGGAYKADKEFYPAEWFEKAVEMDFEGVAFPVPSGWHFCLSRNYGDYMELPPKEARCSRHKTSFSR